MLDATDAVDKDTGSLVTDGALNLDWQFATRLEDADDSTFLTLVSTVTTTKGSTHRSCAEEWNAAFRSNKDSCLIDQGDQHGVELAQSEA